MFSKHNINYLPIMKKTLLQRGLAWLCPVFLLVATTVAYAQPSVSLSGVDPTCGGFTNGSITATGSGGWGPYNFTFSNGATANNQTTATVSGLTAGTYSVTIVDMDLGMNTATITLNSPAGISATASQNDVCDDDDDNADGTNSSATVSVSGGTAPYTYMWANGQTSATATGLSPGLACVTVMDANACGVVECVVITAPLSVSASASSLQCADFCDASVTATINGGVGPYTIQWNTGATGEVLENVGIGTYTVTVTDGNGCTETASATVSAPNPIMISVNVNNPSCNGGATGSATVMVVGGNGGNFTYEFSDGQTTQTAVNLAPGSYSVTVRGTDGCDATANFTISTSGNIQASVATTDATCAAPNGGSATATATGGGNYSYAWNTGANTQTITGLAAGTYSVTVTDGDTGCVAVAMGTVMSSDGPTITTSSMTVSCNGGTDGMAAVMVNGGTQPYTFSWNTGSNQPSISNVGAGTYTITVTDANGCSATASVTVSEPSALDLTVTGTSPGCSNTGGSATANVNGGTAPYTYNWSNGATSQTINNVTPGTYSVTVTDANGCSADGSVTIDGSGGSLSVSTTGSSVCAGGSDGSVTATATGGSGNYSYAWSNGANTATISGLAPGTYTVTATDNVSGCTGTSTATVTASGSLDVSANGVDFCQADANGGSATATATGGSGNYSYAWSNGASTATITGLAMGTYTVTVTDNSTGCTGTASATVSSSGSIELTATGSGFCAGDGASGSATATAGAGSGNYTYAWSNGGNTATITGLPAGTYTVTATDNATGCTATATATVSSNPAPSVTASVVTPLSTFGVNDGEVTATGSGGTGPYTYSWSNGSNTQTISGLGAGTYTVTLTDANGCTATDVVVVNGIAKVGGRTFEDVDNNGQRDGTDPAIPNVSVTLTGTDVNSNAVSRSTSTGTDGTYVFDGLMPGTYKVTFGSSGTFGFTTANTGSDATDSDANASTGMTNTFTLNAGDCILTTDAGYFDACDNFVTGGEICCDQVLCGPGNDPDPLTETVAPQGGSGAIQYLWMSSNQNVPFTAGTFTAIPGATSQNYDPGPISETTYFVRCIRRTDDCPYVESNIIEVRVDGADAAVINGPVDICTGSAVSFSAGSVASANASYSWNFGLGASPATATTENVTVTYATFGVRAVTLTVVTATCTSSTSLLVNVSDNSPACDDNLQVLPIDVDLLNSATVEVSWDRLSTDEETIYTIERSADGNRFEAIGEMRHTLSAGSMESFYFTDDNPLEGHSFYRVYAMMDAEMTAQSEALRITRFLGQQNLRVFPNPTTGQVIVDLVEEDFDTEVRVDIITPAGRVLRSTTAAADAFRHEIDLSDLPNGLYIVRFLYGSEGIQTVRITKE